MPQKSFYSKLLLAAILLTLVAVAAQGLLPHRRLSLVPSSDKLLDFFLLPVADDPDHKKVFWIDRKKFHFHCVYGNEVNYAPCNLIFMLSNDGVHGLDLSPFKTINLNIRYKGNSGSVRLAIRHFDPRFSTLKDSNSAKFNNINLRTSDLQGEIHIGTDELAVAEWWIGQFNLPRAFIHPDVRNATVLSIDIPGDMRNSEHDIEISKLEFTGDWISAENWYLGILLVWIVGGGAFTFGRVIYLQRQEHMQRKKISDLVVTNSKLQSESDTFRRISTVDALTNAFNRYGIEQILDSLDINATPTSIIMLDLDNFKRINDKRGHDAGDRVLQKFAQQIASNTRSSDRLGRWGGEEFILICPDTQVATAASLAEKLRKLISETQFEEENPLAVSASFGVAEIQAGESFKSAFKRADEALYHAKAAGRNCVMVAGQEKN